jgi:hypothetical protein
MRRLAYRVRRRSKMDKQDDVGPRWGVYTGVIGQSDSPRQPSSRSVGNA